MAAVVVVQDRSSVRVTVLYKQPSAQLNSSSVHGEQLYILCLNVILKNVR